MGLFLLDYGAGNVHSIANSIKKLGFDFQWISCPDDFRKATTLVFPGVGAFETAIEGLSSKGLLQPLRDYINSGKPYFGICIGMQVLFKSSTESPFAHGLGCIPAPIDVFSNEDKSVPHMGWNSVEFIDPEDKDHYEGLETSSHYYFVHSYRAEYDKSNSEAAQWVHSTSQYGQEVFVASVRRGNVFGVQFHPEKSGLAGLKILDTWLRKSESAQASAPTIVSRSPCLPKACDGLTKRIIACMDVRANDDGDLVVTKGDQYNVREKVLPSATSPSNTVQARTAGAVRNLGKPVLLAEQYFAEGADELCLLNITSFRHSPLHDQPMLAVVRAAATRIFIPLTIGGGIKDTVDPDGTKRPALEVAGEYFRAGADKVSMGSEAVYAVERMLERGGSGDGTSAIETIARVYGRQAVVVSIDPKRTYIDDPSSYSGPYKSEIVRGKPDGPEKDRGRAWWYQCTVSGGRELRPLSVVQLAQGVEKLGAGEILVNSIDRDGTGLGFDLDLVRLVKQSVRIPVVASSGAGKAEHFTEVFERTGVEAALAAGIFHRGDVKIQDVKEALRSANVKARS
ncbi:imidazole glycerol phosphate synthase HisHF [Neolentinus lepideus HHB14362 ss-1]|uniref:Imidazole glycerol phosphate synthase hisHF n=1 Tax=Neolentinus lepideus HHB14362 ss-1 TaxID=1314782 RepID=A0A165W4C8_9AGAM|nr:imidazole glycerol phosphate synthase HisHF [Neolentinus lepideus HHB14362 ss-1]